MQTTHWLIGGLLVGVLGILWLIGKARYWAERSQRELEQVDRSKLREWDDKDDDWPQ